MNDTHLALAGLRYYWRTHGAVALGVAAAVAVLAGSFLVGASVRESLSSIAASRLGRTDIVIAAEQPFSEDLAARLRDVLHFPIAPVFAATGLARHETSGRLAAGINIYGVDDTFFAFHGLEPAAPAYADVLLSPDLATELASSDGDAMVIRLARPTDIPLDSLHGKRDDVGRSMRLTVKGTLARERMGEFALAPSQGPSRAVFVSLWRLQRDLELPGRVTTLLIGGGSSATEGIRAALSATIRPADLGLRIDTAADGSAAIVESTAGLIPNVVAESLTRIAARGPTTITGVLTWLANRMSVGERTVPYSLVTALGPEAGSDPALARLLASADADASLPPIVLNEWAARDLNAAPGSRLEIEYYRWADEGRLVTDRASFSIAGVIPMTGLAVDRRLAPDYPGITTAANLGDWDPPFPIDLRLVRRQDEEYWDSFRTAPKAFVRLADGQRLWKTRHGELTSIRIRTTAGPLPGEPYLQAVARDVTPASAGITVIDVRAQAEAASAGTTDFGAYFSYFSFFLMVSALLLAALFFRLGIEQRQSQIGVLRAAGFSLSRVRRLFILEGAFVAAVGGLAGAVLAVAWAALMMFALRTWWVDAVGTTLLTLHVDPAALAIGMAGAFVAAVVSIALTVRGLARQSPRSMLTGASDVLVGRRSRGARVAMLAGAAGAAALLAMSLAGMVPPAGGFFGTGALMLVSGLAQLRHSLGRRWHDRSGQPVGSLTALAVRNAAWRPGRSLAAAGLVSAAVFLLVSVDSFRKTAPADTTPASGTGGFQLIAESELPVVHDLGTSAGRTALGLAADDPTVAGLKIFPLRLRPGDDASCLNLYQPKQPRLVAISNGLANEGRFRFARVLESADEAARRNPWTLLRMPAGRDPVPAIVDQTSLQYVLHAAVGDVITIDAETSRPIDLRVVASLDDSILQGEILIGEEAFRSLFPEIPGYRVFLVAADGPAQVDPAAQALEAALEPYGFDAQSTAARLEAFHRVENTYLSTFQALGGLGLMLGCVGLVAVVARNVLERRRELALLGAAGFSGAHLRRVVAIEHISLMAAGLAIGVVAAAVAIAPATFERGGAIPWHALVWLLPVAVAGVVAAYGATRTLKRLPLVASLRND
jgi:putative ABC transport system permease protein